MRRDQLEHAIRTACQIIGASEVIIVGSQAILSTYREDERPAEATMSVEIDVLPVALPGGRRERLVKVQNPNTAAPSGHLLFTGWCLDKEDACVAKLCACARRIRTSSPHASTRTSSTRKRSPHVCTRCHTATATVHNVRSPG
jgi:hypothetical protein